MHLVKFKYFRILYEVNSISTSSSEQFILFHFILHDYYIVKLTKKNVEINSLIHIIAKLNLVFGKHTILTAI